MSECLRVADSPHGVILTIRVSPRAGRSAISGVRGGALLVRLAAAPVEGAANAALLDVLAHTFDVPRRSVTLLAGERSRDKRVRIAGLRATDVTTRLAGVLQRGSGETSPPYAG